MMKSQNQDGLAKALFVLTAFKQLPPFEKIMLLVFKSLSFMLWWKFFSLLERTLNIFSTLLKH